MSMYQSHRAVSLILNSNFIINLTNSYAPLISPTIGNDVPVAVSINDASDALAAAFLDRELKGHSTQH